MKLFIVIPIAFILFGSCRTAKFTTVNITGFGQGKVAYPKVHYPDKLIEKKINTYIASAILGEMENDSDFYDKLSVFAENIYDLHHTVTYNKNQILSFNVFIENCGAFCSPDVVYFNFDLATGEPIEWAALLSTGKKDSFEMSLKTRIQREWNEYKASDLDSISITDSSSYEEVMESFKNCMDNISISDFAIYPDKIEFISRCYFPRFIRVYTPRNDFPLSRKDLAGFLKPEYLSVIKKK